MNNYRIIFLDIDDTLIPHHQTISPKNQAILTKLAKQGIQIVLTTGRSINNTLTIAKLNNICHYIISSNGSEVYDIDNNKLLFHQNIKIDSLRAINNYCCTNNLDIICNSGLNTYTNNKQYLDNYNAELITNFNELITNNDINQIILLGSNYNRMLVIPELFKKQIPEVKIAHISKALYEKKPQKDSLYFYDLVRHGTSKATGVSELLSYLNINPEEALAIGNGPDDIPLIDIIKTFIAVGNACEELKSSASLITDNCENDGVAKILSQIFGLDWE